MSQQQHVLTLPEWVTDQQPGAEDRYLGSQRFVDNNWNLPGSRELFLDTNAAASIDDSFIENFLDLCVQGKCAVRHEGLRKVDGNPGSSYYSCTLCACTACRIRNIKVLRHPLHFLLPPPPFFSHHRQADHPSASATPTTLRRRVQLASSLIVSSTDRL